MISLLSRALPGATRMIRMDHTHVVAAFHKYRADAAPRTRQAVADTVCLALEIHAQLEEEIFYPAMRAMDTDRAIVDRNVPEHDEMRRLIGMLRGMEPADPAYDDTFLSLMRTVLHHVAEEETTLLPDAERLLGEDGLRELGAEMAKRRLQLVAPRAGEAAVATARTWPAATIAVAAGILIAGTLFFTNQKRKARLRLA